MFHSSLVLSQNRSFISLLHDLRTKNSQKLKIIVNAQIFLLNCRWLLSKLIILMLACFNMMPILSLVNARSYS